TNCIFRDNQSVSGGGGIFCHFSNTTVINCDFVRNSGAGDGGGAAFLNGGSPVFIGCRMVGNCTAAVVAPARSTPMFINCTVANNRDDACPLGMGGGIFVGHSNEPSHASLRNCVVWGNTFSTFSTQDAQVGLLLNGSVDLEYCTIEGWDGTLGG